MTGVGPGPDDPEAREAIDLIRVHPGTPRRTRRRLGLAALLLLIVAGVLGARISALFTDGETVSANDFDTGDLDLTVAPATAVVVYSGMIPGDVVTAPLTVTNAGSAGLRYSMDSTTTEDLLAAQLDLTVKVGVLSCTNAGFGGSGTVVYGPNLLLGSTLTTAVFGSPATGDDPGDRTLAGGANEELCLRVELPITSDNSYQGRSTTATFSLDAEQTGNNP